MRCVTWTPDSMQGAHAEGADQQRAVHEAYRTARAGAPRATTFPRRCVAGVGCAYLFIKPMPLTRTIDSTRMRPGVQARFNGGVMHRSRL